MGKIFSCTLFFVFLNVRCVMSGLFSRGFCVKPSSGPSAVDAAAPTPNFVKFMKSWFFPVTYGMGLTLSLTITSSMWSLAFQN